MCNFASDEYQNGITCILCGAQQEAHDAMLGTLGNSAHFRCVCCGGQWNAEVRESDAEAYGDDDFVNQLLA